MMLPPSQTDDIDDKKVAWDEVVQFSREFHGKPLTKESRASLSSKRFRSLNEELLDRALKENVNCFVAPGISVKWSYDTLDKTPRGQIQIVSDTLRNLARLLYKFSSLS
jgi:hypothetical protein